MIRAWFRGSNSGSCWVAVRRSYIATKGGRCSDSSGREKKFRHISCTQRQHHDAYAPGPSTYYHHSSFSSHAEQFDEQTEPSDYEENGMAARITNVANNGDYITIQFNKRQSDGDNCNKQSSTNTSTATYHASWLWSNDPQRVLLPSGQRASTPGQWVNHSRPKVKDATIIYCNLHHNDANDDEKDKVIRVPGPTINDCCHPLAVYGDYPAWIMATVDPDDCNNNRQRAASSTSRPYLKVVWTDNTTNNSQNEFMTSIYDLEWLQRFQYNETCRLERQGSTEVKPINAIRREGAPLWYSTSAYTSSELQRGLPKHDENDGLVHVQYQSIIREDGHIIQDGLFQLLHSVIRDGAAIVSDTPMPHHHQSNNNISTDADASQLLYRDIEDIPENDLPVSKIAKAMSGGELSHGSLYGNIFHVRVGERNSNNIAYTSTALCPHQDLAYYESPPGMQLLHCVANGRGVVGGESTLIDAMAAAFKLREIRPESFERLVRLPATFVKQRDGACMTYRRPHIVLAADEIGSVSYNATIDIDREITAVFWSPPFEGPVCLPPEQVDQYYEAYADFERILNGSNDDNYADELSQYAREYTWQHKLNPGEILVFNNRRMVHGRNAFSAAEGVGFEESQRHLVGCYTNIDDTLNSYRVLLRERGSTAILNVGNGSNIL